MECDENMAILRSEVEESLDRIGVTGFAAEKILKETAADRHRSRVEDARRASVIAVREYVYDKVAKDIPEINIVYPGSHILAMASGLCLLDCIGIGGHDGVSGDSTSRIPCFRTLGKGRKQARDGGAWSAAIEYAGYDLAESAGYGGRVITIVPILPQDALWGIGAWSAKEAGIGVELPTFEKWEDGRSDFIPIPAVRDYDESYDYARHYSLARECLRIAVLRETGIGGAWHNDVAFNIGGTAAEWGTVVNEIKRIMDLPKPQEADIRRMFLVRRQNSIYY